MSFYKPFELFYYEAGNKKTTRCVESFSSMRELLERKEQIKKTSNKAMVFPDYPDQKGGAA
jgi:hypothetical protein